MNSFEVKIIKGKLTALEVGLQSGAIPLCIIRQDATKLLEVNGLPDELAQRLRSLILAASEEEERLT